MVIEKKKINVEEKQIKIPYFVWCMGCGFEKCYFERLSHCPICKTSLHEKRYLM